MADDKWISDLHGGMPVHAAARRVLAVRLGVVRDRLPWAVHHADEDDEHVHQLRVGTRRAGAALRIFADCLPGKLHKRARKALKQVRRAAGAARDWDVFLAMLNTRLAKVAAKEHAGLDFLLGYGHGQRIAAQQSLGSATDGREQDLHQLTQQIDESLADEPADDKTLRDLAIPTLTQLIEELETAAAGDLSAYEALHQVRILGKQLRYAMEVFESCFAPAFREEFYPRIVEMQDILGTANDSHVAAQRLTALRDRLRLVQPREWTRCKAPFEQLLRYHQRRLPEQRRHFARWWADWKASGAAAALERLIHST